MKRTSIVGFLFSLAVVGLVLTSTAFGADVLRMATTTSTDNTGLLNYLEPYFEKDTGLDLQWTAVGTGKALQLGIDCNVDVLLVHAPAAEKKYVDDGYGTDRREVMYNDFVIIGPPSDPAGVKGKPVVEALTEIRDKKAVFVSRGDNSGTNKKELSLWDTAGIPLLDKETWYVQTGQGMLATINITTERKGYTMTDRGTFIKYEADMNGNPPLVILVEGDKPLLNQYSVLAVNKQRCENARYDLAMKFSDWIAGAEAQKLIGEFKLLGKVLFTPNAK